MGGTVLMAAYIDDLTFLCIVKNVLRDYVGQKCDNPITPKVINHIYRTACNLEQAMKEMHMTEAERRFTTGVDALCTTINTYLPYIKPALVVTRLRNLMEARTHAKDDNETPVIVRYGGDGEERDEHESEEEEEEEEEEEDEDEEGEMNDNEREELSSGSDDDDDDEDEKMDDEVEQYGAGITIVQHQHHPLNYNRGGKAKVILHANHATFHFH